MKRGFLNTKKAARSAVRHAPDDQRDEVQPGQQNLPVGNVETAASEHRAPGVKHVELGSGKTDDLLGDACIFTAIPNVKPGTTLAEYPDNWTECIFLDPKLKHVILNTPNFPTCISKVPIPRQRITVTPSMGLGVFATCDLKMNDLILVERPLVILPNALSAPIDFSGGTSVEQQQLAMLMKYEKALEVMVGRMIPENRAALMSLENVHKKNGSGSIFGILRTNGFGISALSEDEASPVTYSAVFDKLSRLNHSCAPNGVVKFNVSSFSSSLRAVRDIKKGEQIFISYCEAQVGTAARHKELAAYGFECVCPRCTDPASDALYQRIVKSTMEPAGPLTLPALLAESLSWMKKIEAAGLQALPEYGTHMIVAWRAEAALGRMDEFERYQRMWKDWYEVVNGKPHGG